MAKAGKKSSDKWIQNAIKNPGALRKQAVKEGAITEEGTIITEWLKKKAKQGNTKTARRARLALTLRKISKNKKKK